MDTGNQSRAANRARLAYEPPRREAQAETEENGQGSAPFSRQEVAGTRNVFGSWRPRALRGQSYSYFLGTQPDFAFGLNSLFLPVR